MILMKVGGGAEVNLEGIAADLAALGEPAVVVHGANAARDDLVSLLKSNRFRPRLTDGGFVDSSPVVVRYRLYDDSESPAR